MKGLAWMKGKAEREPGRRPAGKAFMVWPWMTCPVEYGLDKGRRSEYHEWQKESTHDHDRTPEGVLATVLGAL